MSRSKNEDPLKGFRFRVFIDGFARAGFQECSDLEQNTEVIEYREGGQNETAQKSPGLTSYPNITLTRGQMATTAGEFDMFSWAQQVHKQGVIGNPGEYRRELDIVQYDASNIEVRRWRVDEAWVCKFVPFKGLSGQASENSLETIEIANEGWDLA